MIVSVGCTCTQYHLMPVAVGHGVLYFKLFSVLLQEMTFEIDEDFLYAMLDFAQFNSGSKKTDEE